MCRKQSKVHSWMYIACIAVLAHHFSVVVEAIDPGEIVSNLPLSSPGYISASKLSSLWLHWNFTYGGNSKFITYKEQIIGYTSKMELTLVPLATRTGVSGTLAKQRSITGPFSGRIDVIPDNSTLVVHNLRFNDSGTNFSSFVNIETSFGSTPSQNTRNLEPVVTVEVIGVPEFTLPPLSAVAVSENSNLEMKVQMDGNPKPSAIFQWLHDRSKDQTIPGNQLYPYIYESTYALNNVPASFCGRVLTTRATNSIGTSATISTNVTVLPNLDAVPNPQAGKPSTGCVRVKWNKIASGNCFVKYEVQYKDNAGTVRYTNDGTNIGETRRCRIPAGVNITQVQLKISFKSVAKNFTINVLEGAIPTTPAPTTKPKTTGGRGGGKTGSNTGAIIGGVVGGIVLLIIIVLLIVFCKKKHLCCWKDDKESGHGDSGFKMEPGNEYSVVHRKNSAEERNPVYESANNPQLIYQQATRAPGSKPHKAKPREPSDYAEVKVDEHGYPAVGAMSHSDTEGYVGRGNTGGHRGERDSGRRVAPERRPPPPYNDRRYPQHELVEENPLYQSADIRR